MEKPIADIVTILEGPGKGATSAKNNDTFRVLLNSINVLENRAKARRRALLMVSGVAGHLRCCYCGCGGRGLVSYR